jgi:hypothetical protein
MNEKKSGRGKLFLSIIIIVCCTLSAIYASNNITPRSVHVSGYTRRDGTRVRAYNRRPPGSVAHDAPYETLGGFSSIGIIIGVILAGLSIKEIKESHKDKYSKHDNYLLPHKTSDFIEIDNKEYTESAMPELSIEYLDANGKITKRQIKIISIAKYHDDFYIRAYCFLRNDERTFKFSRIIQLFVDGALHDKSYFLTHGGSIIS